MSESTTAADYKAQVKAEWTASAAPWGRWHSRFSAQFRNVNTLLLAAARVQPGMRVLDLASGSGDPALTLATQAGPSTRIVATDLVPEMLGVIDAAAREQRLENLETRTADMEALPFGDSEFDLATCRFGLMFSPRYDLALREIRRVLKPGARAVFVVWAGPDQPFFNATSGVLMRLAGLTPPPPEAPSPFRFARPGSLSQALSAAGFLQISEEAHEVSLPFAGTPDEMWEVYSEVQGAIFKKFERVLGPARHAEAVAEIKRALERHYDGKVVDTPGRIFLAAAVR